MNNPDYIHVGVRDHWIKCGNQFGNNYVALKKENDKEIICEPNEATCVVCGRPVSTENCLPRDY